MLLFLCSAVLACTRENTVARDLGDVTPADPVDLLDRAERATGYERALVLERLGLTKEAIAAWDAVVKEGSERADEARRHRNRLLNLPDPTARWPQAEVDEALARGDCDALTRFARELPTEAARYGVRLTVNDREAARLLAAVLAAQGERYPQAILDAFARPRDRKASEQGLLAFRNRDAARAIALLERAGNPLYLRARYSAAAEQLQRNPEASLQLLDAAIPHLEPAYRELSGVIHGLRANALENRDNYFAAHAEYQVALAADDAPTSQAMILSRRSANYLTIGSPEQAFRDAHRAVGLLNAISDLNTRIHSYGTAANAAMELGHPLAALHYQNAAVEDAQKAVARAASEVLAVAKKHLAVTLRHRADIHVELGRDADAEADLTQASELADAVDDPDLRRLLQMRIHEVRGQWRMSEEEFSKAIALAGRQDSTYRAVLHHKRAAARRKRGDFAGAAADLETARTILRAEATRLVDTSGRGEHEDLWTRYFSRFAAMYRDLLESRIAADDGEGAFVEAELARGLEPLRLLARSKARPRDFRPIEDKAGLQRHLHRLPDDTAILHFAVMEDKTYTWVLTRGKIQLLAQPVTRKEIEQYADNVLQRVALGHNEPFRTAMRVIYTELFREPLRLAPSKRRIVIIPDGPMYRLPFSGLCGTEREGYLIERASIATAASTSLYFYALERDRDFDGQGAPSVLLVGDPALHPATGLEPLHHARPEVEELARVYRGAQLLVGAEATAQRFLAQAPQSTIVHFAGHAIPNPEKPWLSRLVLAPQGDASGELTAERLMQQLSELERTRLVVLGACSTADGQTVGPQGLASLVRPLIAANVPAVVGTLWNVNDATSRDLLVSLHRHYRDGDDVAVALRLAQLKMLRNYKGHAMDWAAFQVVGHAGSPYPRPVALEEPHSEHVRTQNSLLGPDGLHSQ